MKILSVLLALVIAVAFVSSAMAVAPGKSIEYPDGPQGKVTFNGKTHADAGSKCNDCHTKLFPMKKGSMKMTQADHGTDKWCGACHNGTKAFSMKDAKECSKCHKK